MALEQASQERVSEKFSQAELERIGRFLADAASEFANHGCNDFGCPATAENKALFIAIIKWQAGQSWGDPDPTWIKNVEEVQSENEQIFSFDNWAMGYFAQRCRGLVHNAAGAGELSSAELRLMASLLDLMVEWREMDHKDRGVTEDYTLTATDENRRFLAEVIKHEGQAGWERMVEDIMSSDDEIAVVDFWIMRYFSDRCRALAEAPLN